MGCFRAKDAQRLRVLLNNLFDLQSSSPRQKPCPANGVPMKLQSLKPECMCGLRSCVVPHNQFNSRKLQPAGNQCVTFSLRQTYTSTGNVTTVFCCTDTKTAVFVPYPDLPWSISPKLPNQLRPHFREIPWHGRIRAGQSIALPKIFLTTNGLQYTLQYKVSCYGEIEGQVE
jgi:hypothetical protein